MLLLEANFQSSLSSGQLLRSFSFQQLPKTCKREHFLAQRRRLNCPPNLLLVILFATSLTIHHQLTIGLEIINPIHQLNQENNITTLDSSSSRISEQLSSSTSTSTLTPSSSSSPSSPSLSNGSVVEETTTKISSTTGDTNSPSNANNDDDRSLILGIIIASIVIFIIGFIGNSVVILVIMKFTKTGTVTDIYILNLAFADLMFITGLIFLVTTMFVSHWIFGNLMCKLYMATTSLNQFASSLLLVVMSFDRFLAVCHPIYAQRFRRLKRAKIICLCIWIVCLILMTPILTFAKINNDKTCAIFWPDYKSFNCEVAFTVYAFAIGFAVPLLLIAAFYLCVIRKLRLAASGQTLGSSRRSRSRENTNKRIEHLVIGIICTYTICWLPYWITQLCVSFTIVDDRAPAPGFYEFFLIASCLSYTNSALNPILYAFLSDNFKRRCSEIFRSIFSYFSCFRVLRSSKNSSSKKHRRNRNCTAQPATTNHQLHHHQHNLPNTGTTFTEIDTTGILHQPQHYNRKTFHSNHHHHSQQQQQQYNFKSPESSTIYNNDEDYNTDAVSRQETLAHQTVVLPEAHAALALPEEVESNQDNLGSQVGNLNNSPCPSITDSNVSPKSSNYNRRHVPKL